MTTLTGAPNLCEGIRDLFAANAVIRSTVGSRIFTDHLPQSIDTPAIVLLLVSGTAEDVLDGFLFTDEARVQVDSYGATRDEAVQLWQQVRLTLTGYRGITGGVYIKAVTQLAAQQFVTDRALAGSAQYRFISSQDFGFFYDSKKRYPNVV